MAVNACIQSLQRLRTDKFFQHVKAEASNLCEEPVLPRTIRPPRRLDNSAAQHVFVSVEEYYKRQYFEAIDIINAELERRFLQESFLFVREIKKLLLNSANAISISLPEKMESIYHEDLDLNKLKVQPKILPDIVKVTPMDGIPIKQVTRVQTLCQILNLQPGTLNRSP